MSEVKLQQESLPQDQLQHHDFTKFNVMKPRLLEAVDRMLSEDIARLMAMIPVEEAAVNKEGGIVHGMIVHHSV